MRLPDSKRFAWSGILTMTLIGLLVGLLLLLLSASLLIKIVFVILGIITVLSNIPGITMGLMNLDCKEGKLELITSLISAVVDFLMIFWHSGVLMIVLGVYMVVLPLIEILISSDKSPRLKTELPKLILGVVLILLGPARTLDFLFDVAGICVIVMTLACAMIVAINMNRKQNTPGGRIFVDSDGDGSIDTVYVDTTGDGEADTATRFREKK
jgi:ABC-type amino acid transport system permease subunit